MNKTCAHCNAEIIWARSWKTKRWIALDAARDTKGIRFIMCKDGFAYNTTSEPGHVPHHETCAAKQVSTPEKAQWGLDV